MRITSLPVGGMMLTLVMVLVAMNSSRPPVDQRQAISATLDALHDAASKADGERYFACFAPDAVFLGTDATERWTLDEFKTYAMKRFETGQGWTYTLQPGTRHIAISEDGSGEIAWFDELLDNAKYGTCRGTGLLRRIYDKTGNEGWKIVQYNLTFTVPNDAAKEVVDIIRKYGP
jgi:ketosteroid isomerase-like protein